MTSPQDKAMYLTIYDKQANIMGEKENPFPQIQIIVVTT